MNVAFYAPLKPPDSPIPSGDRLIARMIVSALARHGARVETAARLRTFDRDGDARRQARLEQIGRRLADRLADRLARRPPATRPDVWLTYHLYHKAPDWLGPAVARALAIPYVVIEASVADRNATGAWRHGHGAVCRALAAADLAISINPRDVPGLVPHMRPDARRHLARPFIDGAPFRAAQARRTADRAGFLARHRLAEGMPILATVAMMRRDAKLESYRVLADALARIAGRPWQLVVAGDGPARDDVAALLAGLKDRVRLLGALDTAAVAGVLAQADLMVWPAVNEAIGMVYIEAQAAGLPVVGARRDGTAAVVRDGETGLLVAEGDAGALADAVACLLDDPGRRQALGHAALHHAADRHDIANAGLDLFRAIASLGP